MERYRLQVDRQTKNSYPTHEAAEAAGAAIKEAHPLVQVAVYDAKESTITVTSSSATATSPRSKATS